MTHDKLLKMLAHHQQVAAAIETVLGLLEGGSRNGTSPRMPAVLKAAVKIDKRRRMTKRKYTRQAPIQAKPFIHENRSATVHGKEPRRVPHKVTIRKQRERSAAYLAKFDRTEPRSLMSRSLGSLVRRGYLAPKEEGYIRTAKEYTV